MNYARNDEKCRGRIGAGTKAFKETRPPHAMDA
jgi:hypothetical protein